MKMLLIPHDASSIGFLCFLEDKWQWNEYVGDTQEIDDPFGGSFDVYEQTYIKIYDLVDKIKFKHE